MANIPPHYKIAQNNNSKSFKMTFKGFLGPKREPLEYSNFIAYVEEDQIYAISYDSLKDKLDNEGLAALDKNQNLCSEILQYCFYIRYNENNTRYIIAAINAFMLLLERGYDYHYDMRKDLARCNRVINNASNATYINNPSYINNTNNTNEELYRLDIWALMTLARQWYNVEEVRKFIAFYLKKFGKEIDKDIPAKRVLSASIIMSAVYSEENYLQTHKNEFLNKMLNIVHNCGINLDYVYYDIMDEVLLTRNNATSSYDYKVCLWIGMSKGLLVGENIINKLKHARVTFSSNIVIALHALIAFCCDNEKSFQEPVPDYRHIRCVNYIEFNILNMIDEEYIPSSSKAHLLGIISDRIAKGPAYRYPFDYRHPGPTLPSPISFKEFVIKLALIHINFEAPDTILFSNEQDYITRRDNVLNVMASTLTGHTNRNEITQLFRSILETKIMPLRIHLPVINDVNPIYIIRKYDIPEYRIYNYEKLRQIDNDTKASIEVKIKKIALEGIIKSLRARHSNKNARAGSTGTSTACGWVANLFGGIKGLFNNWFNRMLGTSNVPTGKVGDAIKLAETISIDNSKWNNLNSLANKILEY